MASPIRIKRRAAGAIGAPETLLNAELAFNEVDDVLYYGKGTAGGDGTATTVIPIGGPGAFVGLTGNQNIGGTKTFTGVVVVPVPTLNTHAATKKYVDDSMSGAGLGDMLKSVYDPNNNGFVDKAGMADTALAADTAPWGGITGKPTTFAPAAHTHPISEVTDLQTTLNAKAPLASPAFTGNPTAVTQIAGNVTTRLATTEFVSTAIANLIDGSPGVLDTLAEIAAALGDDPNFAATMTTELAKKMEKTANLSDVQDVTIARTNLGLLSMAIQAANAVAITGGAMSGVAITGGTIDGVTIDGGTF